MMDRPVVNLPWVESPFFGRDLGSRPHLSAREIELVTHFHTHGFAVLPDVLDGEVGERLIREIEGLYQPGVLEGYASYYRIHDAWKTSPAVKEVALSEKVLSALRLLYGREPLPFQTLNFRYGSEQANHSDAILFNSLPERFMCGVWVALEDVDVENGPLFYHPGSQKLKQYFVQDFEASPGSPDDFFNQRYPLFIHELMQQSGYGRDVLSIKRGSALIWSSNLVHGGMPRLDRSRTRWTQVTHYYFEGCIYYVPLYSDLVSGALHLRDVVDVRTGKLVPQTYNGAPFEKIPLSSGRHRVELVGRPETAHPTSILAPSAAGSARSLLGRLARRLVPGRRQPPLPESPDLILYVDGFDDGPSRLSMFGWAFVPRVSGHELKVVLDSSRERYVVDCVRVARPDVAAAHATAGPEAGFSLALEKSELAPGTYRVGIQLRPAGQEPLFRFTDRRVVV